MNLKDIALLVKINNVVKKYSLIIFGITFKYPELEDNVRIYFHNQNFKMKKLFLLPILSVVLGSSFLSTAKADYCYRTNHSYGNGYSQRCSNGSSSSYYDDNNDEVEGTSTQVLELMDITNERSNLSNTSLRS